MAINSFKKTMEKTILNMKCIVMVIFSYILWDGGRCILYIGNRGGFSFFFFFLSLKYVSWLPWRMFSKEVVIFDEIFCFLPPNASVWKGQPAMSQCVKLTEMWREWDTDGERRGIRKLYSAKLCKYTHFTLRSVSKSNILKMDFVYYCTVQDSALNVLWLL